eukprot:354232-Chlamydomonas_euryale.AAC.8
MRMGSPAKRLNNGYSASAAAVALLASQAVSGQLKAQLQVLHSSLLSGSAAQVVPAFNKDDLDMHGAELAPARNCGRQAWHASAARVAAVLCPAALRVRMLPRI